jgi:hypothetical protein
VSNIKAKYPQVGDVVQTADGKLYRQVNSAAGDQVTYHDHNGRLRSCSWKSWIRWCDSALAEGGHYRRAGEFGR